MQNCVFTLHLLRLKTVFEKSDKCNISCMSFCLQVSLPNYLPLSLSPSLPPSLPPSFPLAACVILLLFTLPAAAVCLHHSSALYLQARSTVRFCQEGKRWEIHILSGWIHSFSPMDGIYTTVTSWKVSKH